MVPLCIMHISELPQALYYANCVAFMAFYKSMHLCVLNGLGIRCCRLYEDNTGGPEQPFQTGDAYSHRVLHPGQWSGQQDLSLERYGQIFFWSPYITYILIKAAKWNIYLKWLLTDNFITISITILTSQDQVQTLKNVRQPWRSQSSLSKRRTTLKTHRYQTLACSWK